MTTCCDFVILFVKQGSNADALALYFNEDPARCPFEQGNVYNYDTIFTDYLIKCINNIGVTSFYFRVNF